MAPYVPGVFRSAGVSAVFETPVAADNEAAKLRGPESAIVRTGADGAEIVRANWLSISAMRARTAWMPSVTRYTHLA
jgi:hypothetical protein